MNEPSPLSSIRKAELHLHLEGSLGLETIERIGNRKGLPPPDENLYVFKGFEGFNAVFKSLGPYLETEEDFRDAAYALTQRQAGDRVVYTEASVMPLFHTSRGLHPEALFRGIEAGLSQGEEQYGVRVRLLFSIPRIFGPDLGYQTLELLEHHPWDRVLGIDLAGTEKEGDVAPFAPVFEKARSMGLHTVAHAGEFTSADQVRQTLDLLHVERIGHGIRAVSDPALVERLARDRIPLEVCPTSNERLDAAPADATHPLCSFHRAGVPLVIAVDDPALFHTTLSRELGLLEQRMGFSRKEVLALVRNAFHHSFAGAQLFT